ncbi:MAG: glutamine-hydrolyzing carbamoyl-phosphate synthase small subunit [Dehalococcoidia bacterium]|nr:glutamine-hydrolyzing carbamoyl-phosphate synthase small subunit [Dehalococcoidia bacterium]
MKKAILVLEDGSVYEGYSFGGESTAWGEVVFNTSMTGYQEMLTDPSYAGQIVVPTYPLIGNYGINEQDVESRRIQVKGFVIREECPRPSHWQSQKTLHQYLAENSIPGLAGVDTRALTRHLRSAGVMLGLITSEMTTDEALHQMRSLPRYETIDYVKEVCTGQLYSWSGNPNDAASNMSHPTARKTAHRNHIVVVDGGVKYNILRILHGLGNSVVVAPCTSSAKEILKLKPDGVVFSPGPGNPALLGYMEEAMKGLVGQKPVMGICLGHQILGRAFGGKTFKLKFGHRGGNHPVKDLTTGRVHITAQNHGFAVDGDKLGGDLEVSQVNLNDGTVEGLRHKELPVFSIQYHSEASPGPRDNVYMFERFMEMVRGNKK